MNTCSLEEPALRQFLDEIGSLRPRPHHSTLMTAAGKLIPDCNFRHAASRGGWYRLGGVVRPDGTRLADDLESWAEAELEACDGDLDVLLERHAGDGLLATRQSGKTHYFVAPIGQRAEEFVQIEIEELQELLDRQLLDPEHPPADLPELLDPAVPLTVEPRPLGPSRYNFRRLTDMRAALARQPAPVGRPSPLARFMAEWDHSRAAAKGHFCDHWIVAVREHQDRYRNPVLTATPVSRHARELKYFHWQPELSEAALSRQLMEFDRAAGYPSAWYFHLVAGALVPRELAYSLGQDLKAGFRYLAEADIALLEGWLDAPYSV